MLKYKIITAITLSVSAVFPLITHATIEEEVAALDVRVTDNENNIVTNDNRISTLEISSIDDTADVVILRKSCATADGNRVLDNCFTNITDTIEWIRDTKQPSESNPLKVDIGPGTFMSERARPNGNILTGYNAAIEMNCDDTIGYTGHTSFIGSGKDQTILSTDSINATVKISDCTGMTFNNITIEGLGYGAIIWSGGGTSSWNDVNVNAVSRAWYENCGTSSGSHYWTSSKITSTEKFSTVKGYDARCDESWFFGSEITIILPDGANVNEAASIAASENGIIHVYGSVLRSITDGNGTMPAAYAKTGGEIHIHGTGIDLISATGKAVTALKSSGGGKIHANETAYSVQTTGAVTRIDNAGGHVNAPYLWPESGDAPNINSQHGADMAVVTNTTDNQPHLVIYSDNCTSGWFDTSNTSCRSQ